MNWLIPAGSVCVGAPAHKGAISFLFTANRVLLLRKLMTDQVLDLMRVRSRIRKT
jgi:hypothetical protein